MNAEEAFNALNAIFIKTSGGLTQLEKEIFVGIWNDKSYPNIRDEIFKSEIYIKQTSSSLFEKIEALFGIQGLKKKNLRLTLEQLLKHPSPVSLIDLQTDNLQTLNFNNNFLVTNPFVPISGIIDDPQLLFPRSREIRNVFETLNSGSSVAIIGERAIGKSSLLMEICRQAPNKLTTPRQPIYLDLNGCMDGNQVYSRFANKIGIEINNNDLYSALQNHKLLLALDNVECQGFTRSVRNCLRSLAEGSQSPLKLVIAATKFLDELFDDSQAGGTSPLAGICQSEVLKPWDEAIIRKFIDSRLKAPWLKSVTNPVIFTEEEIARLIAESSGHPQKLMQLCYQTYAGYLEEIQ